MSYICIQIDGGRIIPVSQLTASITCVNKSLSQLLDGQFNMSKWTAIFLGKWLPEGILLTTLGTVLWCRFYSAEHSRRIGYNQHGQLTSSFVPTC